MALQAKSLSKRLSKKSAAKIPDWKVLRAIMVIDFTLAKANPTTINIFFKKTGSLRMPILRKRLNQIITEEMDPYINDPLGDQNNNSDSNIEDEVANNAGATDTESNEESSGKGKALIAKAEVVTAD